MKNKIYSIILIVLLGMGIVACGQNTTSTNGKEEHSSNISSNEDSTTDDKETESATEEVETTVEDITEIPSDELPTEENTSEETTQEPTKETETTDSNDETKTSCEKNGHSWMDATCKAPKTCKTCGKTEGKVGDHKLSEANYQEAAKCTVCGTTVGKPLTPNAVAEGLAMNGKMNTLYKYTAPCSKSENHNTEATVEYISYNVFSSDETHEYLEGYEWHVVMIEITYKADENTKNYGYKCQMGIGDYYKGELNGSINYYGKSYSDYKIYNEYYTTGWLDDDTLVTTLFVHARVPKNYDGIYMYLKNDNIPDEEETDRVYFRFNKSNTPLKTGDIKWGINDYTLYIWGNGEVPDKMIENNTVWWDYAITKLVITDGITSIGNGAFSGMFNLETIIMSDSVKKIGETAFLSCISVNEVRLSQNLESIGKCAFSQCFALKKIDLPNSLNKLGDGVFFVMNGDAIYTDTVITYKGKTYNNSSIQNVFK